MLAVLGSLLGSLLILRILSSRGRFSMASNGLSLGRFTNLDQEIAPEYSNPRNVPAPESSPASTTEAQPLAIPLPHDTVTLSTAVSQRSPYQASATSLAASVSDAASYPSSAAPSSESSQSSTVTGGKSTVAPTAKEQRKPQAPPRESEASQNDPYQATTQTTQQSLLQLDGTLQQIGVNPQDASLIRRVALVRLANDPPALAEYFGPSSSVVASIPKPPSQSESAAPKHPDSDPTPNPQRTAQDAPHQKFAPEGKLLNVSA